MPPIALERGELKSKAKRKKSLHFNGSEENIELILCTIISANQLSIYVAVADLRNELPKHSGASGKPDANEYLETMEIPAELPSADPHTDGELEGNFLQYYERKIEQLSDDQKLPKLCSDAGWKIVENGEEFITLDAEEDQNTVYWCSLKLAQKRGLQFYQTRSHAIVLYNTRKRYA